MRAQFALTRQGEFTPQGAVNEIRPLALKEGKHRGTVTVHPSGESVCVETTGGKFSPISSATYELAVAAWRELVNA